MHVPSARSGLCQLLTVVKGGDPDLTHTAISTGTFQPTLVARAPIVTSPLSTVGTRKVWERTRYLPAGVCVAMACGSTVERGSRASCDTYHALVSSPRTWRTRKLPPHLCLISLTDHRTAALGSRCRLLRRAPLPIVFFVYTITPDRDGIARECIKSSHYERLPPLRHQSLVPGSNHAAE